MAINCVMVHQMERHVIKGRKKNRGKYLCYARMAGLSPSDGYVWLPEQSKAARWDEYRVETGAYPVVVAEKYNGYFVRLTAKKNIVARVRELKRYIAKHAHGAKERPACYWLDGDWSGDEGPDYCWDCATKEVDKAYAKNPKQFADLYGDYERDSAEDYYDNAIRGGYLTDHGSIPHCDNSSCGIELDGTLTDDGADAEICALTTDCAPSFDDIEGWYALDMAVMNIPDDDPRWNKIARVVRAARKQERAKASAEAAIAAAPGMTEVRESFLSLLVARQEQRSPDPSFQMWSQLLEWRKAKGHFGDRQTPEHEKLEGEMAAEALKFARSLRLQSYWSSDMFMIKAPYGTYYWPFVVLIEQHRLWKTPAFVEGQACGPRCDRDSNPYPNGSYEHDAWDGGLMSTWVHE